MTYGDFSSNDCYKPLTVAVLHRVDQSSRPLFFFSVDGKKLDLNTGGKNVRDIFEAVEEHALSLETDEYYQMLKK